MALLRAAQQPTCRTARGRRPTGAATAGRRTPPPNHYPPPARGFLAIVSSPPPPSFPQQALDFPNCCWAWLLSQQTPSPKLGWVTRGKGHARGLRGADQRVPPPSWGG